jgi:hypothetical protein
MQPDLFNSSVPEDSELLKRFLAFHKTWCTRVDVAKCLGWSERRIREAAEALGSEIVRCQAGFKLTRDLNRDDLPLAQQCADASISQAKKMIRYAIALRKRLHSMIG